MATDGSININKGISRKGFQTHPFPESVVDPINRSVSHVKKAQTGTQCEIIVV
jgi:hypothetical protein